ncbi:MAG: XRE family transcriptional regulator [Lachnospiraceae bacterium]|nr:XRE family transcriptional regulator [Lachnospiraceae bacterium]
MRADLLWECETYIKNRGVSEETNAALRTGMMDIRISEVDAYLRYNRDISFNERLFLLIDRTGQRDSDVYKKAKIDRRLFSKIRSNKRYIPSKKTVIALCLALELNREEADALLSSAGYSLSRSDDYDLAIAFCMDKKVFDLFEVNEVMVHFGFDMF